jgi:hypothetical protein
MHWACSYSCLVLISNVLMICTVDGHKTLLMKDSDDENARKESELNKVLISMITFVHI